MTMTYTSLTGARGVAGSVANWVAYNKLDIPTIVDEAQTLLYTILRVREMRSHIRFTMPVGTASTPLPAQYLDPQGPIYGISYNLPIWHRDMVTVQQARNFQETSGTLGNNPLTTTSNSGLVSVSLSGHGFNQDSSFFMQGASAVGGLTPNGTFDIVSITDVNDFVIDCSALGTASSGATGGGASITYTCDSLNQGSPAVWAVWDESIRFDAAFNQQTMCDLLFFKQPILLSPTNQSNFLTNRYPYLMRRACVAAAHDFMENAEMFQLSMQELEARCQLVSAQDDLSYRGAELMTMTP